MNSKIYLDGLQSLDEEVQPGLLAELRLDTPDRLHSSVMAQIRNEKKKKFYMNYRFYMPVAAAVLIAAIFVNGGKNLVNQLYPDKHAQNTIQTPQPGNQNPLPSDPITNTNSNQTNIASITPSPSVKDNTTVKGNTAASPAKKPSSTDQNKNVASGTADDKSVAMNDDISGKDINPGNGNNSDSQNPGKNSNINLEITTTSQSEIINFLNTKATLVEDGVYKLNVSYIKELNAIITSGAAKGTLLNNACSEENYFIIRLVISK